MDKKIKTAFVGCGRISEQHFKALKHLDGKYSIVAVCDTDSERLESAAEKTGAPPFDDYDEMLRETDADAVVIATPSGMHPYMGIKAAEAGKHVITEKPMAIDLESADSLICACEKADVQLFVIKQNRLNTTMQLLKGAIDKGRFGKIYTAYSNVFWQRPQEYYELAAWRGTWELDGGAFMNQASHYVDALYWLMGDVERVTAITATLERNIEAEDTGSAVFRFKSGAIGSMNVTMLTYPKNLEGSITILGQKGTAKVGGIALNKIDKWVFEDYDDDDKIVEQSNYVPGSVYGFGHTPYYDRIYRNLLDNTMSDTDGHTGRKSLEIILAIYRSAAENGVVELPLTRKFS